LYLVAHVNFLLNEYDDDDDDGMKDLANFYIKITNRPTGSDFYLFKNVAWVPVLAASL